MKLSELAAMLGSTNLNCPDDTELIGISTLGEAGEQELSFVTDKKYLAGVAESKAAVILVPEKLAPIDRPYIALKDVWSGVLKSLKVFYPNFDRRDYAGVHPSAVVDSTADIAADAIIGPLAVIGAAVKVESGAYIGPGVVVGPRCVVGERSTIYANAVLEADTRIGKGVYIQPGAVIGGDGFKYELLNGRWTKIPQVGRVVLGDNVEVGANSCIDRASYTVTAVDANTKLDNLVQIAHNAHIGENCVIVSQSGVAGSTTIGSNSILAAQAGVADNLTLGQGVIVLGQSGVKDNVKDGVTMFGSPARPFRQEARIIAVEGRLPELAAEVARLTEKIARLEELLEAKGLPGQS